MDFFDLVNISERYMELVNPSSPEKVIKVGQVLRLTEQARVLDMGCGFGEVLALWADRFGVSGTGVDIRNYACQRASKKMADRGLSSRINIVCASGSDYGFEKGGFDVAVCMGATFIWGGFQKTIQALKTALKPGGRLVLGEVYWLTDQAPPAFAIQQRFHTEIELPHSARQEGFDVEYVVRASTDDWDRYQSDNWYGLLRWLEENPDHPERQQVIDHLHAEQDEYFTVGRKYLGWAIFILRPIDYSARQPGWRPEA